MITQAKCLETGENTNKKKCQECKDRIPDQKDPDKCKYLFLQPKRVKV